MTRLVGGSRWVCLPCHPDRHFVVRVGMKPRWYGQCERCREHAGLYLAVGPLTFGPMNVSVKAKTASSLGTAIDELREGG